MQNINVVNIDSNEYETTADSSMNEARRQLEVCNACRYCESFCSVFPAVNRERAFSEAMRRWQDMASSQPPPSAKPFTAATTGTGRFSMRLNTD